MTTLKNELIALVQALLTLLCVVAVLAGACQLAAIDHQNTKESLFKNEPVKTPSLGIKEALESELTKRGYELAAYGKNGLKVTGKH